MQYTLKSGTLFVEPSHRAILKLRSALVGSVRRIYDGDGDLLAETDVHYVGGHGVRTGDVRNKKYVMNNSRGEVMAVGHPEYAEGDDPDLVGWPICRLPVVDHAVLTMDGSYHTLTMLNSRNYSVRDMLGTERMRISHEGVSGGWAIESDGTLTPELICGMFAFGRYIEQENEFMTV